MEKGKKLHILVVPFPAQGHINPMLQFSKRLLSKGLKVTLANPLYISKTMQTMTTTPIQFETYSDGFDENGMAGTTSPKAYLEGLETVGSKTLSDLINNLQCSLEPISGVIYDGFLPWVLDVAKEHSLYGACFFTQSCAVNTIYYYVQNGVVPVPFVEPVLSLPGLPPLEVLDLPSFISVFGSYPAFLRMVLNQFCNIEKADWIFLNSFDQLEQEVVNSMSKLCPIRLVGPTVPSLYLDGRVEGDNEYGVHLFEPSRDACINWLDTKEPESVVYISFGSMAAVSLEQMEELAWALRDTNCHFLWVVRASEMDKLPKKFFEETSGKGLVVTWCSQLEVLSHKALGCFVTHCGWNSVLEALSLGVPMVALPQWTDQGTNTKFVEDVWGMGVRARVGENGISRRGEIVRCVREIMEGVKGREIKMNARKWKGLAKEAMDEGGSSDRNIEEFVSWLIMNSY